MQPAEPSSRVILYQDDFHPVDSRAQAHLHASTPQTMLKCMQSPRRVASAFQLSRQARRRFRIWRNDSSVTADAPTIASLLSRTSTSTPTPSRAPTQADDAVTVHGWVRSVRKQKRICFAAVGDGSTLEPLQVVLSPDQARDLSTGAAVRIRGHLQASPGTGQSHELRAQALDVVSEDEADLATYPLQKKYHTHDFLRSLPHLRSRTPFNTLQLRLRSHAIAQMTAFFAARDFVQTHPPIITSSDCEGAGEVFPLAASASKTPDPERTESEHFFRHPAYLTVSAQLHLEALAHAHPRVWALSPTFRAETSDTARHLSEFYMLEVETGFTSALTDVTSLLKSLLRDLASSLLSSSSRVGAELLSTKHRPEETPDPAIGPMLRKRWEALASPVPWPRITYTQALRILNAATPTTPFAFPLHWGLPLHSEHERYLACAHFHSPVFVTDYPARLKPFYMLPSASPPRIVGRREQRTVACFDLLLPSSSTLELAGGSLRQHSLPALRRALDRKRIDPAPLDWYLDLRRWGSVPHGGFGLGFDRLLAYLAGVDSVKDVVAWPRWAGRCDG